MSVHGNSFGKTFVDWSDELYVQSKLPEPFAHPYYSRTYMCDHLP